MTQCNKLDRFNVEMQPTTQLIQSENAKIKVCGLSYKADEVTGERKHGYTIKHRVGMLTSGF